MSYLVVTSRSTDFLHSFCITTCKDPHTNHLGKGGRNPKENSLEGSGGNLGV